MHYEVIRLDFITKFLPSRTQVVVAGVVVTEVFFVVAESVK